MAAAVASPSDKRPRATKKPPAGGIRLKLQPALPQNTFLATPVETVIYYVDEDDRPICNKSMPLVAGLFFEDHKEVASSTGAVPLVYDPPSLAIDAQGMCRVRFAINELSMNHSNRSFVICIRTADPSQTGIPPVFSPPFNVIRHKLSVKSSLPEVWYKDEGGRDKCMELEVQLEDARGRAVPNRPIPLRVVLEYVDGHHVTKQDILKLAPGSKLATDDAGMATIRFRIEDVSKNHQNLEFRLRVLPDTAKEPLTHDVASDASSCVSVRSKRNKRQRVGRPSDGMPVGPVLTGQEAVAQNVLATLAQHDVPPVVTLTPAAVTEGVSATKSLNAVIQWINGTVKMLQDLEWQTIGFESKADGSRDNTRPLYRCPGCWGMADVTTVERRPHGAQCPLATSLRQYATESLQQLHHLARHVHGERVYQEAAQRQQGALPRTATVAAHNPSLAAAGGMMTPMVMFSSPPDGHVPAAAALQRTLSGSSRAGAPAARKRPADEDSAEELGDDSDGDMDIPGPAIIAATTTQDLLLEGPPMLARGFTDMALPPTATPGPPPQAALGRYSTFDHWVEDEVPPAVGKMHPDEAAITCVMNRSGNDQLPGFPAFSANLRLMGLYQLVEMGGARLSFRPAADLPAAAVEGMTALARQLTEARSPDMHYLANHPNLERLVENVLLTEWQYPSASS